MPARHGGSCKRSSHGPALPRHWAGLCLLALCFARLPLSAQDALVREPLRTRVDAAISRGIDFLLAHRNPDGGFRSTAYSQFGDDLVLTPLIAKVLHYAPHTPEREAAFDAAVARIAARIDPSQAIDPAALHLSYPVYTSSMCVVVLSLAGPQYRRHRDAWLTYLRLYQHTAALGYTPDDLSYGGWGYSLLPPKKGGGEEPGMLASNLSATVFAIGALRFAEVPADDPAYAAALVFIERCQNYAPDDPALPLEFRDGGFFFSPEPHADNKGGSETIGSQTHFHSYLSASADGLRALTRCSAGAAPLRVRAAQTYLESHFVLPPARPPSAHPEMEVDDHPFFFYSCWSLAHAFNAVNRDAIQTTDGSVYWADLLAKNLLARQNPDGSWARVEAKVAENDPLQATPMVLATLIIARMHLSPAALPLQPALAQVIPDDVVQLQPPPPDLHGGALPPAEGRPLPPLPWWAFLLLGFATVSVIALFAGKRRRQ